MRGRYVVLGVGACLAAGLLWQRSFSFGAGAGLPVVQPETAESLRIYHVDVGQGDATIIVGPGTAAERKVMIVDAGDTPRFGHVDGGLRMIQALRKLGITKVDYVVLTHHDADHIGGFVTGPGMGHSVLLGEDNAPGTAGVDEDGDQQSDWLDAERTMPDWDEVGSGDDLCTPDTLFVNRGNAGASLTQANIRYLRYMEQAKQYKITSYGKLPRWLRLGPGASAVIVCGNGFVWGRTTPVPNVDTENERSVGVLVTYRQFDYLVCGDLTGQAYAQENANVEEPLADALLVRDYAVEVLHVNHHGASNASRPAFIQKLKPLVGVISVGNGNEYHHPTAKTLQTLFANNLKVYQTEEGERSSVSAGSSTVMNGHILIETDGAQFRVKPWGTLNEVEVNDLYAVRPPIGD